MPTIPGLTVGQGRRMFVGKPATRKAFLPCTAPNATTADGNADLTHRTLLLLPFGVTRWRIGFLNHNPAQRRH